jgi:hypothetical protein
MTLNDTLRMVQELTTIEHIFIYTIFMKAGRY